MRHGHTVGASARTSLSPAAASQCDRLAVPTSTAVASQRASAKKLSLHARRHIASRGPCWGASMPVADRRQCHSQRYSDSRGRPPMASSQHTHTALQLHSDYTQLQRHRPLASLLSLLSLIFTDHHGPLVSLVSLITVLHAQGWPLQLHTAAASQAAGITVITDHCATCAGGATMGAPASHSCCITGRGYHDALIIMLRVQGAQRWARRTTVFTDHH